ncbi:MAG: FAD-binding oxidoreductase, partial [Woeseiaceae bacterium]
MTDSHTPAADIAEVLRAALGPDAVLSGDDLHGRSAGIWGPPRTIEAQLLVRPRDTEGVSRALAICHQRGQSVVVHGGLTGVVDGAWSEAGDVVLSLEALTGVEAVDPLGATT